jgi:hypothetical protein
LDANYHLLAGSPCINTGVNITLVTHDYDNHLRTDGANDIGADEFGTVSGIYGPSQMADFEVKLIGNPVIGDRVVFEVSAPAKARTVVQMIGLDGKLLLASQITMEQGKNTFSLELPTLSNTDFVLRVGNVSKIVVR